MGCFKPRFSEISGWFDFRGIWDTTLRILMKQPRFHMKCQNARMNESNFFFTRTCQSPVQLGGFSPPKKEVPKLTASGYIPTYNSGLVGFIGIIYNLQLRLGFIR